MKKALTSKYLQHPLSVVWSKVTNLITANSTKQEALYEVLSEDINKQEIIRELDELDKLDKTDQLDGEISNHRSNNSTEASVYSLIFDSQKWI